MTPKVGVAKGGGVAESEKGGGEMGLSMKILDTC